MDDILTRIRRAADDDRLAIGQAWALLGEAADEIERLRAALRGHSCPGDCTQLVGECVDSGWCGCDDGPALVDGYKPTASETSTPNDR